MGFTAQPVDGSSPTPIPMSSAVPDGTNTPLALEGGPTKTTGGNTLAPAAVYQYDGYNETTGLKADAAYTDGTGAASGTGMGLFKGIFVKLAAIATAIVGTLKVKGDFTEVAGQGTGVVNAANTDFLPATDISAYRGFSVTIAGTWSATLTFQVSNDATFTTFQTLVVQKSDAQVANFLSVSANGTYGQTLGWRYMRVRATAFTSNASLAGIFEFFTTPPSPQVMGVTQLGTWTVQPGNTPNTTPWLMAGPNANGTQAANSAANTVIKGSSGWLYHAIITTLGTAGLTIYDNASTNSGTPLLVIPASAAVGTIYSFPSGARAVNGITSAGVTNCPAVTFHYT